MPVLRRAAVALCTAITLLATLVGVVPTARAAEFAIGIYGDEATPGEVGLWVVNEGTASLTGCDIILYDDWARPLQRLAADLTLPEQSYFAASAVFEAKAFIVIEVTCSQTRTNAWFTARTPGFTDVSASNPFYTEITWLSARDISTGYADGTYRPLASIDRNAMAAFLHRLAGSPAVDLPATSPFTDVATDDPFYAEICWLASTGITTGYGDGTFRPLDSVSRGAMAAFLFRFVNDYWFADEFEPYVAPDTPLFRDVPLGSQFYREISWLAAANISTGWPDGTFRPQASVARDAMAAFLYRLHFLIVLNTPSQAIPTTGVSATDAREAEGLTAAPSARVAAPARASLDRLTEVSAR